MNPKLKISDETRGSVDFFIKIKVGLPSSGRNVLAVAALLTSSNLDPKKIKWV